MWFRLSENVLDELKYPSRNHFRRLERLYSETRTFLPRACSSIVHRVLYLECKEPYTLDWDIVRVYALVSPFGAKTYVEAVGFRHLHQMLQRFQEHLRQARVWSSNASKRSYYGMRWGFNMSFQLFLHYHRGQL